VGEAYEDEGADAGPHGGVHQVVDDAPVEVDVAHAATQLPVDVQRHKGAQARIAVGDGLEPQGVRAAMLDSERERAADEREEDRVRLRVEVGPRPA